LLPLDSSQNITSPWSRDHEVMNEAGWQGITHTSLRSSMIRRPQFSHRRGFTARQQQVFFYSSTTTRSRKSATKVPRSKQKHVLSTHVACLESECTAEFVERRDVALHRGQVRLGTRAQGKSTPPPCCRSIKHRAVWFGDRSAPRSEK
jgi:hypothetical protein